MYELFEIIFKKTFVTIPILLYTLNLFWCNGRRKRGLPERESRSLYLQGRISFRGRGVERSPFIIHWHYQYVSLTPFVIDDRLQYIQHSSKYHVLLDITTVRTT